MKKLIIVIIGGLLVSGCSVKKEMTTIGDSKADGTVRIGYMVGGSEKPVVDVQQGATLAGKKCHAWGYTGAEAFGGQQNKCAHFNAYGCAITKVFIEYQCTGGKAVQN
ncbi:hypothetical protein D8682_08790 [Buttiauxella sp. 3AFRM03]|uniref:YecR family lipoprotein n=1 Tax=Buttiauxella sp. 3AFRM03 TaxID=2479367 RepID=UPI000EF7E0C6|nr:YecR family lipoprotein [Buttiauxella sp. 3AFRM03]AYN27070.1 hypothetical protein D8682_08790 [Buttiauxella sp. 3AFRM03]